MCGGQLEISGEDVIIECEYCGTKQTLPKNTGENVQALFNRANTLRRKNEFDKAEAIYEKILEIDDSEAEAYWGVILCKFGIEYVEDPSTKSMIPTCHRTSYEAIAADEYYKKAIEHSDFTRRALYEQEAKKIDEIQKGILALSVREEPYDIFICYKETDENGGRTQDSVIANEIYYQLINEGYKVFYAAISLEDKLGSAYEPIIFAALNSAKVMLVVGTKPEYFNAVWVKNEWSRFLKMMKKDRKKMIIPCYKGMDAYELPDEFAHLQSQNMEKIGFINDLVRGIKKIIVKEEAKPSTPKQTTVASNSNDGIAPLITRMFMFLEDGDFQNAKAYCEKVLDKDPSNAQAYLGALMVDLKVKKRSDLGNSTIPFNGNANYEKIIRFSNDEALNAELNGYLKQIKARVEMARRDQVYEKAMSLYTNASVNSEGIKSCQMAIELFKSLDGWKDSEAMIIACNDKINSMPKLQYEIKFNKLLNGEATFADFKDCCNYLLDNNELSPENKNKIYLDYISKWYYKVFIQHINWKYGSLDKAILEKFDNTESYEVWKQNEKVCRYLNDLNIREGISHKYPVYKCVAVTFKPITPGSTSYIYVGESYIFAHPGIQIAVNSVTAITTRETKNNYLWNIYSENKRYTFAVDINRAVDVEALEKAVSVFESITGKVRNGDDDPEKIAARQREQERLDAIKKKEQEQLEIAAKLEKERSEMMLKDLRAGGELDHNPIPRTYAEIDAMHKNFMAKAGKVLAKKNKKWILVTLVLNALAIIGPTVLNFVFYAIVMSFVPGEESVGGRIALAIFAGVLFGLVALVVGVVCVGPQLVFTIPAVLNGGRTPLDANKKKRNAIIANVVMAILSFVGMVVSIVTIYGIFFTLVPGLFAFVSAIINVIILKLMLTTPAQFKRYNRYG